jgi:hypothetical protein
MTATKTISSILALCLLIPILGSQEKQQTHIQIDGPFNGRFWNKLTPVQKIGFLQGFRHGLNTNLIVDNLQCLVSQAELQSQYENSISYEGLQVEVDLFFKEVENGSLPIKIAILYITKKAKGATSKELDEFLATNRMMHASGSSDRDRSPKFD